MTAEPGEPRPIHRLCLAPGTVSTMLMTNDAPLRKARTATLIALATEFGRRPGGYVVGELGGECLELTPSRLRFHDRYFLRRSVLMCYREGFRC